MGVNVQVDIVTSDQRHERRPNIDEVRSASIVVRTRRAARNQMPSAASKAPPMTTVTAPLPALSPG